MTPQEFKEGRVKLGLSISQCAAVFGVNTRTLQYWEADDGKRPIHPTAIKAMTWLLAGYRPKGWPK